MHRAFFQIDGLDGIFEGFTDNRSWNRFACPYFERPVAERIARAFRAQSGDWGTFEAWFDQPTDAFLFRDPSDDPEDTPLAFGPQQIICDDRTVTVYPIGNSYWTWEEAVPD